MSFLGSLFSLGPSGKLSEASQWMSALSPGRGLLASDVSEMQAMGIPVVYSAIGIVSDSLAQLPLDVFRSVGQRKVKQDGHPIDLCFNRQLNRYTAAFTGRSVSQSHVLGWGNGYLEIERRGGELEALWALLPDRTYPDKDGGEVRFRTTVDSQNYSLDYGNVLHVPAWGFDGITGYSPIHMHRNAVWLAAATEKYGIKFFENDAKSGGFIQYPGQLGPKAKDNLEDSANRRSGLEHAHRIKVLEEGAKFIQTTIPPEDAQFLATRTFQVEEVARIYRIPLHMLQSHAKDTSWGTGIHEQQIGFLVFTLAPHIIRWEQEINRKLFSKDEQRAGFYVKFNVSGLLRGNARERAEMYKLAIEAGWLTVNEVRELEDREPFAEEPVNVERMEAA